MPADMHCLLAHEVPCARRAMGNQGDTVSLLAAQTTLHLRVYRTAPHLESLLLQATNT